VHFKDRPHGSDSRDVSAEWNLQSPDDFATAYLLFVQELEQRVVGHQDVISTLALCGVQHIAGIQSQRLLMIGPPGVGKTTLLRSLADVMCVPFGLLDITMLAEQNWQGHNLSDFLYDLRTQHGRAADRALVLLDELDKVATGGLSDSSTSSDYRRGKQQSLLPLLGRGSTIPVPGGDFAPDSLMIVMAGVFNRLRGGTPLPPDLIDLGIMPELVERFGTVLRLQSLTAAELARVYAKDIEPIRALYHAFGYRLIIPDTTLRFLCTRIVDSVGYETRSGFTLLRVASERLLIRLVERSVAPGHIATLHPDDLWVPPSVQRPGYSD